VSDAPKKRKAHRGAERKVRAIYRALAAVARRQTQKLLARAKRIVDGDGQVADLQPIYAAEIKAAIKHAMVEAFKEGRRAMKKKIELGLKAAPASVRELIDHGERLVASVRELDADVLKYSEVAGEYEKWADELIGSTFKKTIDKAREIVSNGIREGVRWNDYGWDKDLGKYTQPGLRSQLQEVFDDYEEWQLRRVAVTEHTRAVGLGDLYEADRDPMVAGVRWVVEYQGCPEWCAPRNGKVFDVATARKLHPPHPNCWCTLDPVFEWEDAKPITSTAGWTDPVRKAAA